ncbi:MAG: hypothetical protein KGI41_01810 [Patescibacteria group bacterium]|nr:hypothetical protein [Patescibacteria group bacterium]MDE1965958.1 hypothetical protein [Patescibacteria group bacterium]
MLLKELPWVEQFIPLGNQLMGHKVWRLDEAYVLEENAPRVLGLVTASGVVLARSICTDFFMEQPWEKVNRQRWGYHLNDVISASSWGEGEVTYLVDASRGGGETYISVFKMPKNVGAVDAAQALLRAIDTANEREKQAYLDKVASEIAAEVKAVHAD